jgi:outer membrane protein TolC
MKKEKIMRKLPKIGLSVLSIIILSGCAKLGPDFTGVKNPPIPAKWKHSGTVSDQSIAHWWKIFHDPTLNTLVKKTYAQNLDLQSAGLRIQQARAILGISQGLAFPQLQTLSGSGSSSHTQAIDVATAGVNFDMGWEMDIWGKYARGIESSKANLYASVTSYQDIMVSVIAEMARNYINYRTAEERLAYAKRNVLIQERVTQMTEIQFNSGNVSELDMQQSRSQLYNTRSALPSLEISKVKARNAMALLMAMDSSKVEAILSKGSKADHDSVSKYIGKKQQGVLQIKNNSNDLLNIEIIPQAHFNPHNKIDAELLTRRPDIKVAEYRVHANSALIGAKMAELYPSISLFGNIGYNTNNAGGSWLPGANALGVTVGPSFSWNIFNYGRIKNSIRNQDAIYEESLVNYNKAVLVAVNEVSNALQSYTLTQKQQTENKKAVEATVRAFNISVIQYNDGLVSYQRLLSTVERLTTTQDRYASIKGNLSLNAISLFKALGGGWQMSRGKSYLSADTAARMKKTVNWGKYLDPEMTRLPKDMK